MIEVIKTGIYSSIQDLGRFGYRNIGVPLSGIMDISSANLANSLLDNDANCAVLETTIIGPTLKFYSDTFIAITGATCNLEINGKPINLNTVIQINAGDSLSIGKATTGVRSYLSVAGGFQTEKKLNSRSFYSGITEHRSIQKGMFLAISKPLKDIINRTSIATKNNHFNQKAIEVFKGPEFDFIDEYTQSSILNQSFMISNQSNRMAYNLSGNLPLKTKDIITSSIQPGTVQLTPSGELIIAMRDCQTTGGYARVLQLSNRSINQLAQKASLSETSFLLQCQKY